MKVFIKTEVINPGTTVFFLGNGAIWSGKVKSVTLQIFELGQNPFMYRVEIFDEEGDAGEQVKFSEQIFETKAELLASLAGEE